MLRRTMKTGVPITGRTWVLIGVILMGGCKTKILPEERFSREGEVWSEEVGFGGTPSNHKLLMDLFIPEGIAELQASENKVLAQFCTEKKPNREIAVEFQGRIGALHTGISKGNRKKREQLLARMDEVARRFYIDNSIYLTDLSLSKFEPMQKEYFSNTLMWERKWLEEHDGKRFALHKNREGKDVLVRVPQYKPDFTSCAAKGRTDADFVFFLPEDRLVLTNVPFLVDVYGRCEPVRVGLRSVPNGQLTDLEAAFVLPFPRKFMRSLTKRANKQMRRNYPVAGYPKGARKLDADDLLRRNDVVWEMYLYLYSTVARKPTADPNVFQYQVRVDTGPFCEHVVLKREFQLAQTPESGSVPTAPN